MRENRQISAEKLQMIYVAIPSSVGWVIACHLTSVGFA